MKVEILQLYTLNASDMIGHRWLCIILIVIKSIKQTLKLKKKKNSLNQFSISQLKQSKRKTLSDKSIFLRRNVSNRYYNTGPTYHLNTLRLESIEIDQNVTPCFHIFLFF